RETSGLSAALSLVAGLNPAPRDGGEHSALQVVGGVVHGERPSAQDLVRQLDPRIVAGHLPTPDIAYTGAWWRIGPDEAVGVAGAPPPRPSWAPQPLDRPVRAPQP